MINISQPMPMLLKRWEQEGLLTPLDRHFALELAQCHQEASPLFLLICALLSKQLSAQHSCLVLDHIDVQNPMQSAYNDCQLLISGDTLIATLASFAAVTQIVPPPDNAPSTRTTPLAINTPLVLDGQRLYLQRYYQFETQVAASINHRATDRIEIETSRLAAQLAILFPDDPNTKDAFNWQKIATATALINPFSVITGGPGTGKTTTVTKLLLLLQLQRLQSDLTPLDIRLVAPTGKAAARLSESIKASKARLGDELVPFAAQVDLATLGHIPEDAATLHRLLGVVPNSHRFRHHQDNPLRLDLLVVDEASMVDLPMMHKLLSALPENARLILLGDQDQLASVEAGAVLADICAGLKHTANPSAGPESSTAWRMRYSTQQASQLSQLTQTDLSAFIDPSPMLGNSLCMLMHSHRFNDEAGIGQLANAVNHSKLSQILQVWQQGYAELEWLEHSLQHQSTSGSSTTENKGLTALLTQAVNAYRPYLEMIQFNQELLFAKASTSQLYSPEQIIECFNRYRLLCAMRAGDFGVDGINLSVTKALTQAKLIAPKLGNRAAAPSQGAQEFTLHEFYLGRPIIIQSNDYNLGLFNGDIGLILQDQHKPDRLMAHFIKADGTVLKVLPARLPSHETCYAMTVHKSQGSEFDSVALVLPRNPSPSQWQLLTKELVYTAITRAKTQFTCLGTQKVFERAASHATQRASGLADRLWR